MVASGLRRFQKWPWIGKWALPIAAFPYSYIYWEKRARVKTANEYMTRKVTDKVYFDIAIGELYAGRMDH